ncbi:MAG: collagen-like protein [Chloroflexi bacterium]|nr:collagen-like protein [Chloroflexota bacterium]
MRFFRLMAIGVVLLVLVGSILGMACAGAKGAQGPKGETGAQGPQGVQGIQGVKGDTGEQGPQGIQGPQGMPGIGVEWMGEWDSAVLCAKYDAVGYQGSSYISRQDNNANNLPTDTNWWDLWVDRGEAGPQGPQGIEGPQGEKGDTGATGAMGAQGVKGDTGAQGTQGIQGIQGPAGPNMVVAMGGRHLDYDKMYNASGYSWGGETFRFQLTGITYHYADYATLVTLVNNGAGRTAEVDSADGLLLVTLYDNAGNKVWGDFYFVVLQAP